MGDPKKARKKYSTPRHPWEKSRIDEESIITRNYALKNKKEIWKMSSMLKGFKYQAKKLSSLRTKQAELETKNLFNKLNRLGLLEEVNMENILNLKIEDIMERRLQTVLMKKGLARSMKQARQFITHGHVAIGNKVITAPSYLVLKGEEGGVNFRERSAIKNENHAERQIAKPVESKKEKSE